MRDHNQLEAFRAADALVLTVYRIARQFPSHERFGLTQQLQRAAISAAANIVEGCARESSTDYARFLAIAYASAREAEYEIDISIRLGYVNDADAAALRDVAARTAQLLSHLVTSARGLRAADNAR